MASRSNKPRSTPHVVTVDMGHTAVVLKAGTTRAHTLRVYRRWGRLPSRITDAKILETIAIARKTFEGAPETAMNRDAYWLAVNTWICTHLLDTQAERDKAARYAREIHEQYLSLDQFTPSRVVMHAVRSLRARGVRVVIASNATQGEVEKTLAHFGILHQFDAMYSSDTLGVRKPDPRFFEKIIEAERMHFPSNTKLTCVHIGNSLFSDSGAATLGWRVLLLDKEGKYLPHSKHTQLDAQYSTAHAARVRKWIDQGYIVFCESRVRIKNYLLAA